MKRNQQLPCSEHFQLEQLADGVYAAIHRDGGWAISNAGVVDLGDRTMVFDSFLTPLAAADLRSAAEELTGRSPTAVINSHYHNDHIWGNQAFAQDADIISTTETRHLIATKGLIEHDWYQDNAAAELESLATQYDGEEDEGRRQELALGIGYYQGLVQALPKLMVRLPNVTFAERLVLHGEDRSAELVSLGGGHTRGDAVLWLPGEGILFTGDLLSVGCHPYLADGDPGQLLRIVAVTSGLGARTLVPGHGPVGTPDDLTLMVQYVDVLGELARQLAERGKTEEELADVAIPEPFDVWQLRSFFDTNLRFLYQRALDQRAGSPVGD